VVQIFLNMNKFFSATPILPDSALGVLRIIIGLMMVYHGQEVFNRELMEGYAKWDIFKDKAAVFMVYAGKSSEFVAGLLLTFGLWTRVAAMILSGTMLYITFFVGHGRFWYEDQHPFMFVLFGVLFFFLGPGRWSLDAYLQKKSNPNN
jgi:putative oxidoreductase